MNRIFKIVIVNIFIFFILIFYLNIDIKMTGKIDSNIISECLCGVFRKMMSPRFDLQSIEYEDLIKNQEKKTVRILPKSKERCIQYCGEKRVEYIVSDYKKQLILLGCSYAYGHGLSNNQSFSHRLQEFGYSVINYSNCGSQILNSLLDCKNDEKNINKVKNTDYFIYIYMYDHISRYLQVSTVYDFYEDFYTDEIKPFKKKFLDIFPLYKALLSSFKIKSIVETLPETKDLEILLKNIILISYKKINQLSPNAKFIIIVYDEKIPDDVNLIDMYYYFQILNSKIWKELEEETNGNIKIVRTKDIMGFYFDKDYKLEEDISGWHPNARVWKEFTPKFVSQYIK